MKDDRLETLVAELVLRHEEGEEGVLEDLCRANPDLADDLRRCVDRLDVGAGVLRGDSQAKDPARHSLQSLGRFRIERELGRGAMGVVYLAHDPKLDRRVAVKVLSSSRIAGSADLARFEREVRAIARLHHPSIVPVYEVGEAEGLQYFSMEYLEGLTLSGLVSRVKQLGRNPGDIGRRELQELLNGISHHDTDPYDPGSTSDRLILRGGFVELVARITLDVASALEHVHGSGIIHRDIKPSNILIRPDGRAMLFDFGLARAETDATLTRTGAVVGTPYYISPEIVRGDANIDNRTDIYSLGATLYELLTLTPPFSGESTQEIFRKITSVEPELVQRINPSVSRDLETICATSLEKDPAKRYRTAADLAGDLRRFLEFRPIQARPVGGFARTVRWVRRNPARSTIAALAFLLVIVVPSLFALYYRNTSRLLREEQSRTKDQRNLARQSASDARREAEAAVRKGAMAERNFLRAREAVEFFLTRVSEEQLFDVPGMEPIRMEIMEEAIRFYEAFLDEDSDDPQVRYEAARAESRIAALQHALSREKKAEEHYRQALGQLDALSGKVRDEVALQISLHETLSHYGHFLQDDGRLHEAEAAFRRSCRTADRIIEEGNSRGRLATTLAITRADLGYCLSSMGKYEDAEKILRTVLEKDDSGSAMSPASDELKPRSMARWRLADAYLDQGRLEEAEALYRAGIERAEPAILASPGARPAARMDFWLAHRRLGKVLLKLNRWDEARDAIGKSVEAFEILHEEFPHTADCKAHLLQGLMLQGDLWTNTGQRKKAIESYDRAGLLLRQIGERPEELTANVRQNLGSLFAKKATFLSTIGRLDEAASDFERSMEVYEELTQKSPEIVNIRRAYGSLLRERGRAYHEAGDFERAEELLRRGTVIFEELVTSHGTKTDLHHLAMTLQSLGAHHLFTRRFEKALPNLEKAFELCDEIEERSWHGKIEVGGFLAPCLRQLSRGEEAMVVAQEALDTVDADLGSDTLPSNTIYQIAQLFDTRAGCLKDSGSYEESAAEYRKSITQMELLTRRDPRLAEYQSQLGGKLSNLGFLLEEKLGRHEEARAHYERAEKAQRNALRLVPGHWRYEMFLGYHVFGLADCDLKSGNPRRALERMRQLDELLGGRSHDPLTHATQWAQTGEALRLGQDLEGDARGDLCRESIDRALSILENAVARGRITSTDLKEEGELTRCLASEERFQELIDKER